MCSTENNVVYPDNLQLNDHVLPWVQKADHLGHVLSQHCNMDTNARILKAKYIEKTIEIRETFSFAHPEQVLRALDIFSSDCYGLVTNAP